MEAERITEADLVCEDRTVECPELQGGKRLVVVVRAVDCPSIVACFKGIPAIAAANAGAASIDKATEFALMREIARHGLVSPALTFGDAPEPARAWWGKVSLTNRMAIATAIAEVSGVMADGGPLGRFPGEPAGDGFVDGAGRTVEASAEPVAAPVAAD